MRAAEWRPRRRPDLHEVRLDDELVLLHPDGNVHRLDRSATAVFDLCDGVRTVAEIVGVLSEVSGAAYLNIEGDVVNLLQQLGALDITV
jgi:hypothetical protein